MKKIVLLLLMYCILLGCNSCNNSDNLIPESRLEWKGVYYDSVSNEFIHDPKFNYTLIFDELNVTVIQPAEITEEKIIAIEVLSDSKMKITWNHSGQTIVVNSSYEFNDKDELIIERFTYTIASIPFPNNLEPAKFIQNPIIN